MTTLNLPFEGNNTEKLFKGILKDDVKKISENYSKELYEIICSLLQIKSDKRPSCKEILNNNTIKKN